MVGGGGGEGGGRLGEGRGDMGWYLCKDVCRH
jgi:hypothetical protein